MPNANDDVFEAVKEVILSQLTSVKEDQIVESARFI
nr:acyl carrier protein [Candidatus Liberibacter asiaticus]